MMTVRTRTILRTLIGASVLIGIYTAAQSKPPAGTDPNSEMSQWYQGLKVPGSDGRSSCCGEADCRAVAYRIIADHYEAFINKRGKSDASGFWGGPEKWLSVPDDVILRRKDNPTGRAQACWAENRFVDNGFYCFVLPSLV